MGQAGRDALRAGRYQRAALQFCPVGIAGLFSLLLFFLPTREFAKSLLLENHIVETITFAAWLVGAVLAFVVAIRSKRSGQHLYVTGFYALVSASMFVMAMEEVNWGQVFFEFDTPQAFRKLTRHREMSLHKRHLIEGQSEYLRMIARKTGSLIRSGLEIGAMVATGDTAAIQSFSRFGSCLGRAFQIRDDILGIWGDVSTTGKATGNDIRRRKKSFPVVYALNHADGQARNDLLEIYNRQELDEDDVPRVLAVLDEVGAQEHSQRIVEDSAADALVALDAAPLPSWAREEAEGLVDFLARREY